MTGCALGLIALAVGYFVLVQANKEKGRMKTLGQVIGVLVMAAAILSGLCAAKCQSGGGCPLTGGKMFCPFTAKSVPEAPVKA